MLKKIPANLRSALQVADVVFARFDGTRREIDKSVGPMIFRRGSGALAFRWRDDHQVKPKVVEGEGTPIVEAIAWIRGYIAGAPVVTYAGARGDHIIVANDRVFHGRTALKAGMESKRWLRRVWIA